MPPSCSQGPTAKYDCGRVGPAAKLPKYIYHGDRFTDERFKKAICEAVRRPDGKCIRGRGNMLVKFETGEAAVVIARLLRKIKP